MEVGETNQNTYGTIMKIVKIRLSSDIDVQFIDDYGYIYKHTTYTNFKRGVLKNPYDISVYGVGCIGDGKYKAKDNNIVPDEYSTWRNILRRCYNEASKDKFPAYYHKCSVSKLWLNYQIFAEWYSKNKYPVEGRLQIDKDILYPGNKIYCPETCILVPQRINMLFMNKPNKRGLPNRIRLTGTGLYEVKYNGDQLGSCNTLQEAFVLHSTAKEAHIKRIADEMKHIIPDKVYKALYAYKCDIRSDKNYQSD